MDSRINRHSLIGGATALGLLISSANFFGYIFDNSSLLLKAEAATTSQVEVWWPVEGAVLSASQPFKALLKDMPVEGYNLYWQVDGGQLNKLENNYNDYPHKEIQVDLSNWNWRGTGPYLLTFSAFSLGGQKLGEKSVSIRVEKPVSQTQTTPTSPLPTTNYSTPSNTVIATTSNPVASPLPLKKEIEIWSPENNANLKGEQAFKGVVKNLALSDYKLYWKVDSGQLNLMPDNLQDSPHKEVLVDLSGWTWKGSGPYKLGFVAKDRAGRIIATTTRAIYVNKAVSVPSLPVIPQTPTATTTVPTPTSSPVLIPPTSSGNNPLSGFKLFVNPNNPAARQAIEWKASRPADALKMEKMGQEAQAVWLGDWSGNVQDFVRQKVSEAKAASAAPVFITYNVPYRDCGQWSAGGLSAENYRTWIKNIAAGIGDGKALVVLEPDSLSLTDCLSTEAKNERYNLLSEAISTLKAKSGVLVYLDAGHAGWINAADMTERLKKAGVEKADGFALNVSNFVTTADNTRYGEEVSKNLGGKHFIIDTSRNGNGPTSDYQWCNPSGRALGNKPTTSTGNPLVDAYLWLKVPGESDGNCNGGPSAGSWWAEYALGLAKLAGW